MYPAPPVTRIRILSPFLSVTAYPPCKVPGQAGGHSRSTDAPEGRRAEAPARSPLPLEFDHPTDQDGIGPATHLPAGERRVATLGAKPGRIDGPLDLRIDDRDVGH